MYTVLKAASFKWKCLNGNILEKVTNWSNHIAKRNVKIRSKKSIKCAVSRTLGRNWRSGKMFHMKYPKNKILNEHVRRKIKIIEIMLYIQGAYWNTARIFFSYILCKNDWTKIKILRFLFHVLKYSVQIFLTEYFKSTF